MEEIKNYRLGEFINEPEKLQEEYLKLLKLVAKKETIKELFELPFDFVYDLMNDGLPDLPTIIEAVAKIQGISKENALNIRIIEFFGLSKSLKEQIETVRTAFRSLGSKVQNPKFEMVGGSKRMAKYGIKNLSIPLAIKFNRLPSDIEKMSFGEVFTLKSYFTDKEQIDTEMKELKI
ncbi:hypothetical protein Phi46:1_gp16 [Cellulophaga phage phi46:1]|uniref:hypothetical protein n=1 Tax=Cellulophaga phage phi46:1 TaxID=1327974 RepID=UPI000351DFC1|nr:hypothetical protein Phi46:1_gp16 [Cellulophaga phage phi46:1]AGO47827.1 hypothetical protein Phi46:1_gp16 [Cellulophaga phage phi46:1]